jgi:hypothetical protein
MKIYNRGYIVIGLILTIAGLFLIFWVNIDNWLITGITILGGALLGGAFHNPGK